jgi:hypothetical protein
MTQWEYLTRFLEAKIKKEDQEKLKQRFNKKKLPKFTPESMIPELDELGAAGWELVHMEPVPKVGGKGDVLLGGVPRWSNEYFCVFKRAKPTLSRPMAAAPVQASPPPQPPSDTQG